MVDAKVAFRVRRTLITAVQEFSMTKAALFVVLLVTLASGCSSVISNSEDFYKDLPRRRINWREYLTD
jgi:hypothetical protein